MKTISITLFGKRAKAIEKCLDLKHDGDVTDINTKIIFEKKSVEGRLKITVTFDI